mgnify:CR=1 FL=1
MRVIYKRTAVKDMEATRDYIAGRLKNPKAAKKLMTALLKAISLLADNPYMGAALAEKFEITTDVRYFVVSKQLIFYRVDEENSAIEILRVLDGRTDYLSVLFGSYKRRIRRICKQIPLKRPPVSAQSAYGPHCMDGLVGSLFSMPYV